MDGATTTALIAALDRLREHPRLVIWVYAPQTMQTLKSARYLSFLLLLAGCGGEDGKVADAGPGLIDGALLDGGVVPEVCETDDFVWSTVQPAFAAGSVLDAHEGALALDAQFHAHLLLYRGGGSSSSMAVSHFTAETGWSAPDELLQNALSASGWNPRVALNAKGDGIATFREKATNVSKLYYLSLSANGDHGAHTLITNDNQASAPMVSFDQQGHSLIAYTGFETDGTKVFAMTDLATPQVVVSEETNNTLISHSFDAKGDGVLLASATATGTEYFIKPHQGGTGFTTTERALPMGTDVRSGIALAWLGNGEMLLAYGTGPADAIELHWRKRSAANDWSTATRFDSGDGGGNIGIQAVTPAEASAAFISYRQQDGGNHVVRYTSAGGLETPLAMGARRFELATDRCGNALMIYKEPDTNDLWMRRYLVGTGWGQAAALESEQTSIPSFFSLAIAPTGEAIVLIVRQSQYYYTTFSAP